MRLNDTITATPQFGVSFCTISRAGVDLMVPRNEDGLDAH